MARDILETRGHRPTVPDDATDPFRFGQLVETAKDALVLTLREFFSTQDMTTGRRSELPTVEKYSGDFSAGLSPYETYVAIVQESPDIPERLPHIAVTAVQVNNKRMTAGRPFIGHTQAPPRVVTSVAGPYALANAVSQVSTVTVTAPPGLGGATYTVLLNDVPVSVTVAFGATVVDVATLLAVELRALVYDFIEVTTAAATVTLKAREPGAPFTLTVLGDLVAATPRAAGDPVPDVLVVRTTPDGRTPIETSVAFEWWLFTDVTVATADDVARVVNSAFARVYLGARPMPVGLGTGVQFEPQNGTPNMIEVMPGTTANLLAVLGLGTQGLAGAGASLTGGVLTVASTTFTPAMVGRFLTLTGAGVSVDGRYEVLTWLSPTSLALDAPVELDAILPPTTTWFVGLRDDSTNPARPVMNRYHMSAVLTVNIDVIAESPNERRELIDLVMSEFVFFLEDRHFTLYGRSVFDESVPGEHWQISIHQEVGGGGESESPRSGDAKPPIQIGRVTVPLTLWYYIDRPVTVLGTGQSYTLEAENITPPPT